MTFDWLKRYAPRSLYGRAALILLTPVIVIQLVVTVVFFERHYGDVTNQMSRNVALELALLLDRVNQARTVSDAIATVAPLAEALNVSIAFPATGPEDPGDRRLFYDVSGRLVIATMRDALPDVIRIDLASDDKRVALTFATVHGPMLLDIARFRVSASNPHQLLVLMGGVSVLMTVIAYLFLRNQVRPIHRLALAAEAFGRGRPAEYRPTGATEVRAAGQAFLDMRHRIERQIEQRTVMLSGVSHDLRTPLTRLKLGLSMMDETPDTADLLGDVRDMEAMVETFLNFAELDTLDDPAPVVPNDLLSLLVHGARRAGQNVTITGTPPNEAVLLRPLALRRALENLINNGVRYGKVVEISCTLSDRAVVFSVQDDGPGIDEDLRHEASKPFARLDSARSQNSGGSVGLGLSIAMDIARQHGGVLRLGKSAHLGGLRADLVLAR